MVKVDLLETLKTIDGLNNPNAGMALPEALKILARLKKLAGTIEPTGSHMKSALCASGGEL